jgi:capsular exopolysaccharide synthesis family protein
LAARTDGEAHESLAAYWRVVAARKYVVLSTFALGVVAASVTWYVMTPIFSAAALVMVEDDAARLAGVQVVYPADLTPDRYYATQCRLIRSRSVLRAAAQRVRLFEREEFASLAEADVIEALASNVAVSHEPNTKLIEVSVEDPDPKSAARHANAVVDCYQEETARRRRESSDLATGWIAEQIPRVGGELLAAERRLQEFREANNILSPDRENALVSQRLRMLGGEVAGAEKERIALEAEAAALRYALEDPAAAEHLPGLAGSTALRELGSGIRALEGEREALLQSAMPDHRDVKALEARIAALEAERREHVETAVAAMGARLEAVRGKESSIRATLAEKKKEALALSGKLIRLNALALDVERIRQTYEPMRERKGRLDLASGLKTVPVQIWDRAEPPLRPVKPRRLLITLVGAAIGLLVGLRLAFLLEGLDSKVRTADELERELGVGALGAVPHLAGGEGVERLVACHLAPRSPAAEAFRSVRTGLLRAVAGNRPAVLLVTSALEREGKTTAACNVASSIAQAGKRVLLVDADMRRSSIHRPLGLPEGGAGLSTFLTDGTRAEDVVSETRFTGLSVVPAGATPENPAELLGSPRMAEFLAWARREFDFTVVDSPPLTAVTDGAVLASAVDGALLVVRASHTPRAAASRGMRALEAAGCTVVGAVLNDQRPGGGTYGRGYGYYREDADGGPES